MWCKDCTKEDFPPANRSLYNSIFFQIVLMSYFTQPRVGKALRWEGFICHWAENVVDGCSSCFWASLLTADNLIMESVQSPVCFSQMLRALCASVWDAKRRGKVSAFDNRDSESVISGHTRRSLESWGTGLHLCVGRRYFRAAYRENIAACRKDTV